MKTWSLEPMNISEFSFLHFSHVQSLLVGWRSGRWRTFLFFQKVLRCLGSKFMVIIHPGSSVSSHMINQQQWARSIGSRTFPSHDWASPCWTEDLVLWIISCSVSLPSFWYNLILVSSVQRLWFWNSGGCFRCFLAKSILSFQFPDVPGRSWMSLDVLGCSWMFLDVPGCSWKTLISWTSPDLSWLVS